MARIPTQPIIRHECKGRHSWSEESRYTSSPLLRLVRRAPITRWLWTVGWMATVTSSEATTHPLSATRALRLKGCFSSLIGTDPATARPVEHVHPPTVASVTKPQTLDSGAPLDRKTGLRSSACSRRDGCRTQNFKITPYNQRHLRQASPVFPPCVLAGSGVSATLPRLWPAAPLTIPVKLKSALQTPVQQRGTVNNVHHSPCRTRNTGRRGVHNEEATLPSLPSRP